MHYSLLQFAIKKAIDDLGPDTSFSVSTNGTLLSSDKIEWLVAHDVELHISIDGTAQYHDTNRKDVLGHGTFERIHKALEYIYENYPDYLPKVFLLMTLPSIDMLANIAEQWQQDNILMNIAPTKITGLAPNFCQGVDKAEWEHVKRQHLHLLDIYEAHPEYLVLKTYFNQCISYWKNRPIVDADGPIPMATCLPMNAKLYIDTNMQIGVCEKMPDNIRLGNIQYGINWDKANDLIAKYYEKRVRRCAHCPAIRMCNLCLTAVEFNDEQLDVLCHNERIYTKINFWLFCEMAERRMIA